jgi:hypothetical protein
MLYAGTRVCLAQQADVKHFGRMIMNFCTIGFETAKYLQESACSTGY